MKYITNPVFSDREKQYIEFILQNDFAEKSAVVEQLNNMREAEISREITPISGWFNFGPVA